MARAAKKKSYTPVMQQYLAAKDAYPDAVLFFRLGDFYEMFFDDAMVVAERLGITQTFRGKDPNGAKIPMAGVPHHAASGYIARLLQQGQKVAICEQMADPSTVKGVVPREVVRVITPGLCLEEENLDAFADNYLVAITGSPLGLAAFELSTGDLRACTLEDDAAALAEVVRLGCREVLVGSDVATGLKDALSSFDGLSVRTLEGGSADEGVLHAMLGELEGKLPAESSVRSAAAMALAYAASSQPGVQLRVQRVGVYDRRSYLQLDEVAIRNLELVRTLGGEKKGSLLHAVDGTVTAMGARLLRRRLTQPLLDVAAIRRRHAQVEAFIQDGATREGALGALRDLPDLERLATRAAAGVASPRDLGAVRQALQTALEVQAMLQAAPSGVEAPLAALVDADFVRPILADLEATLSDEPPALVREGGVIRAGVSADLDEDRRLSEHAKDVLIEIEARERQRTGIASLKIRFNKVFGYFIEVTKSNLKSVPDEYVRKQTIANGERFITDELAELQDRIELADSRAKKLEAALFEGLRERIAEALGPLRRLAGQLASVDVAAGNALVAQRHAYCRPTVDESRIIDVKAGRHAVVEQLVDAGSFVANDVFIDGEGERLLVLTGPNMAGKSTVMRQVALIVVLAQAGAYVPAEAARIGLVDRVFTRIGASDNLGGGQSTFMVEMREAAEILRAASERSLVVLDELGRGTSTYDGLAIAWSIAEHLHDVVQCRALFATHYHELCELAEVRTGVANFTVAAKEYGDDVVFLHSLVRGAVGRSYGVAVARLAGVPQVVLARAKAMLQALESGAPLPSGGHARVRPVDASGTPQLELFSTRPPPPSAVLETLAQIDVDRMAPVDALVTLARLRQLLDEERS